MPSSKADALAGVRVALLESRMKSEMGDLVRRYGGLPRFAPAVREAPLDCRDAVADFLRTLETAAPRIAVFLTGAGVAALFDEAERQGKLAFLTDSLAHATLVCRGPKPSAALKRRGLSATISAREPYTSAELLEALSAHDLGNGLVVVVHYGERHDALAEHLRARGAQLHELCLYEWQLPEDTRPMSTLVRDTLAGEVDAIVFTSQIQARHLLEIATTVHARAAFIDAVKSNIVVAAVGPICRAALEDAGIRPHVVPVNPKMGPLVASLAEYFSRLREAG
jgi:uroporphyrinogen-III synthase